MAKRNGNNAMRSTAIFTRRSANPSETQKGTVGPAPRRGIASAAHDTSLPGSRKVSEAEKAIVKKIAVSRVEPIRVEMNGAFHQA